MTQNFIHLLSETPCTMNVNGSYLGYLDCINNFEFDIITNTNNIFVQYNPICEKNDFLPYSANINCAKDIYTQSSNVQIVPFPNNHCDIIFIPYKYFVEEETKLIFSKNIGKYYVSITNSNKSTISIFGNSSLLLAKTVQKIYNANIDLRKDILILQGIISNDEYYILIFDTSIATIIYEDIVHSINISDSSIETLKNLKDVSHHSLVCKVDFNSKSSQIYYVYENNICSNPTSLQLIPLDFLQCLKIGDESKARTYLYSNLINTDIKNFQNYFGDFQNAYLNRHNIVQMKLNYTLIGKNAKNYNFVISDNKIIDIEEIF